MIGKMKREYIENLIYGHKPPLNTTLADFESVLELLGDETKADFQKIHAELEVLDAQSRLSKRKRAKAINATPKELQHLVPGHNKIPRVYLVHQRTVRECSAYYGGGLHGSSGRTWGGRALIGDCVEGFVSAQAVIDHVCATSTTRPRT